MWSKRLVFSKSHIVVFVFLVSMNASVAGQTQLKLGDFVAPFSSDFPATYESTVVPNPVMQGSLHYIFRASDVARELVYTSGITNYPVELGQIKESSATTMVETSLDSYISNLDNELRVRGQRSEVEMPSLDRHIYRSVFVRWRTNPGFFCRLSVFYYDRNVVIVSIMGLENAPNLSVAEDFMKSVLIQ